MTVRLFVCLSVWRSVWAVLSQTWYVPDETWQSVEVAHRSVWGIGSLTWEWGDQARIRSILHPAIYMVIFSIFKMVGSHAPSLVILLPKIMMGIITALGDVALYHVAKRSQGSVTASWLLLLGQTNWYSLYSGSRTLVNTLESALFSCGLYLYPRSSYVALATFSIAIRPTLALSWAPLVLIHIARIIKTRGVWSSILYLGCLLPWALLGLVVVVIADSLYYGNITITPLNFFMFNIFNNLSQFYGSNPPLWYFTHALPPMIGPLLIPALLGLTKSPKFIIMPVISTILFLCLIPHKEMRFLQPIIPLLLLSAATYISRRMRSPPGSTSLILLLLINIPIALYFSLVHQRGVMDATAWLRDNTHPSDKVLVLMPCHSLPHHSHLQFPAPSIRHLSCDPDKDDEAEQFFSSPTSWISSNNLAQYQVILMFSVLEEEIAPLLQTEGLHLCQSLFHSHLPEGRIGSHVRIWCRT